MEKEKYNQEFIAILMKMSTNKSLLECFLRDVLSPKEYEKICTRWQIIKLLDSGVSQREVARRLHTGIATITRGARELKDVEGGFHRALKVAHI